jgi:hypothetical protein
MTDDFKEKKNEATTSGESYSLLKNPAIQSHDWIAVLIMIYFPLSFSDLLQRERRGKLEVV